MRITLDFKFYTQVGRKDVVRYTTKSERIGVREGI